jgi:hypothetical protein
MQLKCIKNRNPTRLRNMILAVGPTTPAAVCWESHSDSDNDYDDEGDFDHADDDSTPDEYAQADESSAEASGNAEDSSNSQDKDVGEASINQSMSVGESPVSAPQHVALRDDYGADANDLARSSLQPLDDPPLPRKHRWSPSIRHGGCINTACWLNGTDCPWRLSTSSESSPHVSVYGVASYETSTQIMTSSDDRLIKVWDVSHAMGTASPLPGGWDTLAPFALGVDPADIGTPERHASWRRYYRQYNRHGNNSYNMAGSVRLLASVSSGHQSNVFHATPLGNAPGQVLTCGADGYLRITDLHREVSAAVVHPYAIDADGAWEHLGSGIGGMAYSHLSLTAQTGLLCSERGLHRFDLRLSPSEQSRRSLMPSRDGRGSDSDSVVPCKTCVIWSPHSQHRPLLEIEPNLVFVGGSSAYVELLDLRMSGHNRKVLQRYKPRRLNGNDDVSVSGLDVSKDGRELLVSYESDQIYTFPIFPDVSCPAGPSLDDVDAAAAKFPDSPQAFLPELISYGGHLNRYTFLKNAKYAGPNDNFIVTGSDSGKAWIYDRKTGAVASLLGADSSTCNGIIPHPTLPFFITYGIDSTAKLWRAALCVDTNYDDSRAARAQASLQVPFDISPIALQSDGAQANLNPLIDMKGALPDLVGTPNEVATVGRFASQTCPEICGPRSARVGNALRNLPAALRQARYESYCGKLDRRGGPVQQPLEIITARTSWNRLLHQAARLGLDANPMAPWFFEGPNDVVQHVHKAELVPDTPSDWLLFDPQMTKTPLDYRILFNLSDYEDTLQRTFPHNSTFFGKDRADGCVEVPWLAEAQRRIDLRPVVDDTGDAEYCARSRKLLFETVTLLKESGNDAIKARLFCAAARRYDKAIQYCAVAFMRHYEGQHGLKHLIERGSIPHVGTHIPGRPVTSIAVWSPLLRLLIISRLNLSLVLMNPEIKQLYRAADQARFAVRLLSPFTAKHGMVILKFVDGDESTELIVNAHEPDQTFEEAKALEAKAYFRLGSAEFETGNYAGATKSFRASLKCLSESSTGTKTDALVSKRLEEAKSKLKALKKRTSKRFRQLLSDDVDE